MTKKDYQLNGKIKTLQSITRPYGNSSRTETSGFLDSESFDSILLVFDTNGNLLERKNYLDYKGKLGLFDQSKYRYNAFNLIENQLTTLFQNGEEPKKISQEKTYYYLKNKLIRIDEFNSGRNSDQFWVNNQVYQYGHLVKKVFWMEDKPFSYTYYIYDELNFLKREETFSNNGKLVKSIHYEYYPNRLLHKKTIQTGNEFETETFHYLNQGLSEYKLQFNNGTVFKKIYNSIGILTVVEKFNYKTQKMDYIQFEYEFDVEKNWTNCIIFINEKPVYRIKRRINYFI